MGSLMHPVGSLPPGAYWFRRAMVLAVLVVVVAGGWLLFSAVGGSSNPGAHPGVTQSGTTTLTTTPTTPTSTPTTTPTVSHTPTASHSPAAITACADAVIRVVAAADASTYAAGVKPKLTVSVTNTGKVPCKRDIGRAAMGLVVQQGTTKVWSSDDCAPGGQPAVNVLQPGQTFSSTVIWTRAHSKSGCPSGQPAAAAGSYSLVARNLTLKSAPLPFVLH